jgi:hypothetical protein
MMGFQLFPIGSMKIFGNNNGEDIPGSGEKASGIVLRFTVHSSRLKVIIQLSAVSYQHSALNDQPDTAPV